MTKYLDDMIEDQRRAKERAKRPRWYRVIDWGDVIFATVIGGIALTLIGFFIWLFQQPTPEDEGQAHYSKDFRTFCSQLHGKADIDTSNNSYTALCESSTDKVLMVSGKLDQGYPRYDQDFTRYCADRGGKAATGGTRDICLKDGTILMRESKHD